MPMLTIKGDQITHTGLPHLSLAGLGLDPTDPCYDPNRPSWQPYWWDDTAECTCKAANYGTGPGQYSCGSQCVGYGPDSCSVFSVIGSQIGGAIGATAGATASSGGLTGSILLIGVAALALVLLEKI